MSTSISIEIRDAFSIKNIILKMKISRNHNHFFSTNFLRPLSRRKIERTGSEADVGIKNVQRHRDARQLIELDRKKVRRRGKSKEIRESQENNQTETCLK